MDKPKKFGALQAWSADVGLYELRLGDIRPMASVRLVRTFKAVPKGKKRAVTHTDHTSFYLRRESWDELKPVLAAAGCVIFETVRRP